MNQSDCPSNFRKITRRLLLLLLFALLVVQAIPVRRENPTVVDAKRLESTTVVPPEIHEILRRSCNDCHSNETVWPWYSHVAPVSWVVVYDVREGRADLNFSEWGDYSIKERGDKLQDICGRVRRDEMPDGKYTLIHRNARLTADERNAVCLWSEQVRKRLDTSAPTSNMPQASMQHP